MNRGYPEMMLHSLNTSRGAELTVLERQRACMKWQHQLEQQNGVGNQFQAQVCGDLGFGSFGFPMVKPETELDGAWTGFGNYGMPSADDFVSCGYADDSGAEYSSQMMRTASCPVSAAGEISEGKESMDGRTSLGGAKESCKKRKAEKAINLKVVADNDNKEKKIKEWAEDGESKITQQNGSSNSKNKNKFKGEAFKDNSKVSEVQKTDYIHVRARRGQATDSHSLAERVRREKISERMKYLQELVPGCHKITGKAGMLDEIINYVQSLQRQVEFLSMKLATVNPQLNFSIESLLGKDVFDCCTSNYQTASDMANPDYIQFNHLEEVVSPGIDSGNFQPDMGLQRPLSETYVDTTSFSQIQQNCSAWDAEIQNLLALKFQGRSINLSHESFTGSVGASNLKMEI
ncbi:unnamed protein product [Rhodiola kirilowii]